MNSLPRIEHFDSTDTDDGRMLRRRMWVSWRRLLEAQRWRSTPFGPRHPHGPLKDLAISTFATVMRGAGLYGVGRRNTLGVRRVDLDVYCTDLPPEFDGFRLLHISDPHFDLCDGLTEAICAAVADSPADVCVMTGDYRAEVRGPYQQVIPALASVLSVVQTPAGVWATLGNHDCVDMARPIEDLGIGLLVNEATVLRRGAARLRLVGLDDVHCFHTPLADEALATHAPNQDGVWSIALVHSPDMATVASRHGYGLYLCGHTHGGQVCLPGGYAPLSHLDSHRHLVRGAWRVGRMHGYTSCGAGASSVPLRYFTRSEVTRLTLRLPRP
jgi:hypothetical protein